jgi:hypothetical protein
MLDCNRVRGAIWVGPGAGAKDDAGTDSKGDVTGAKAGTDDVGSTSMCALVDEGQVTGTCQLLMMRDEDR